MGHILASEQTEGGVDERRESQRRSSNSSFVGCCYTPRKPAPEGMQTLQLPRHKVLTRIPGQFESDTDTDIDSCFSEVQGGWSRRVHFANGLLEVTVHEWLEDGGEWAAARRSDDVDWANLPEKIERVNRVGFINCRVVPPPEVFVDGSSARRRARLRRQNSKRKSLLSAEPDPIADEASKIGSSGVRCPPVAAPTWSKSDLEVWNSEHIKAVTLQLFERHDAGKKACLSWQEGEVMAFVQDFFHVHGCGHPELPAVVFSTAYNQVKVDSLPSHRDTDGLDMAETCQFARRVYDSVVSEKYLDVRDQRRPSASPLPAPELQTLEPYLGVHSSSSASSASPHLVPDVGVSMVPAV